MAPTPLQYRVMTIVLVSTGIAVTVFRLFMRRRARLLSWDDLWAAVAGFLGVILIATSILHTSGKALPEPVKVACYYMCIQSYYAVIWTSRLSILCTIIRLSTGRFRTFLIVSAFAFVISWGILFAQVFWICESDISWKLIGFMPQCTLGTRVGVAQIITVVIGDSILVLSPIRIVWASQLSKIVKIRLTAIFASTIVTTITSLVYIDALLKAPGLTEEYIGTVHAGVSLLVANLTVVVGFIFKSVSSSADAPAPAHNNAKRLRHGLCLNSSKDSATTLDPSIDVARIEVHVRQDTVIDISVEGHNMTKTVNPKSPVDGTDLEEADNGSSTHDLDFSDEKV